VIIRSVDIGGTLLFRVSVKKLGKETTAIMIETLLMESFRMCVM
jgi:hypothetical protein